MTAIKPRKLSGNWDIGYALDLHTTGSEFLGYDSYGNPRFETTRTEIGELLYKAKNKGVKKALDPISEAASEFLNERNWKIDLIIPVPPSNNKRALQPVHELANRISARLGIPICSDCISKVKDTAQLKDVYDPAKRREILKDAFKANAKKVSGKNVLLLDDLYRSGSTLREICKELAENGCAARIYVLAITETRRNA